MPGFSVEPAKAFADRPSIDRRCESICHTCFRPIVSATRESDLTRIERKHECSPYDLAFLPKFGPH